MSKDNLFIAGVLILISLISAIDVLHDLSEGSSLRHVSIETIILLMSLAGVFKIFIQNMTIKNKNLELQSNLIKTKKEIEVWKKDAEKYLLGLGDAINKQMTRWNLTPAEKEVGLFLLKGFSFKEIATYRNTSERTARQQSLEIYRKCGLAGRAEFSAFFLEDLLLPKVEK